MPSSKSRPPGSRAALENKRENRRPGCLEQTAECEKRPRGPRRPDCPRRPDGPEVKAAYEEVRPRKKTKQPGYPDVRVAKSGRRVAERP